MLLELFVVITRKLRPPVAQDAAEAGCDEIWTEDLATGSRIRGTAIVNPFAAG